MNMREIYPSRLKCDITTFLIREKGFHVACWAETSGIAGAAWTHHS
jgi:hypothetical protein